MQHFGHDTSQISDIYSILKTRATNIDYICVLRHIIDIIQIFFSLSLSLSKHPHESAERVRVIDVATDNVDISVVGLQGASRRVAVIVACRRYC